MGLGLEEGIPYGEIKWLAEWQCVWGYDINAKANIMPGQVVAASCHVTNLEMTKYTMKNAQPELDNRRFFHRFPSLFFVFFLATRFSCHN